MHPLFAEGILAHRQPSGAPCKLKRLNQVGSSMTVLRSQFRRDLPVPWKIDPSRTQIGFSVKHMVISTVRGKFTRYDGVISLDDQHPERSVIEGWVEVARISTLDATRDAYLRSPDFFDVEKFPRITFRSKKITPVGGDRFKLVGALTIKEATRDITFDVSYKARSGSRRAACGVRSPPTPV